MQNQIATFKKELKAIIANVDGNALEQEIENLLELNESLWESPVPPSFANLVESLCDVLNNCEGSELQRELKNLKVA